MIIEKYKNIAQIVRCKENEKIVIILIMINFLPELFWG